MIYRTRMSVLGMAALALAFMSSAAYAATKTDTVGISAAVSTNCGIQTTADLDFGAYDPLGTSDNTATGTIQVRCTKGTAATIQLDEGLNKAGGSTCAVPVRRMASGAERLGYALYQDAGHTTVWSCAAANDKDYSAAGSSWVDQTIYGVLPQAQDVAAGAYSDTITATITY
jgi:spore coat protein U-like protein